jgi:ketosteroid isomerase-like protein
MALEDELQAMCDRYVASYRIGDAAGCAAVFAEDGIMHSAFAPPAIGRAAIAEQHIGWTEDGAGKTLTVRKAAGSGDVAWFLADFSGGNATDEGHSLCVCSRNPDGSWLIQACSLTSA